MNIDETKEIAELKKNNVSLYDKVKGIKVKDPKSQMEAGQWLVLISKAKKAVEEKRQFFVRPLNEQVKRINEMFKGYMKPLLEAEGILRNGMVAYNIQLRKEAEEKNKEIERLAKKTGIDSKDLELTSQPAVVKMKAGSVSARKFWTFKVIDLKKVPREFLMLDVVKVREAIRKGERKIAGLEIYEAESIAVSSS